MHHSPILQIPQKGVKMPQPGRNGSGLHTPVLFRFDITAQVFPGNGLDTIMTPLLQKQIKRAPASQKRNGAYSADSYAVSGRTNIPSHAPAKQSPVMQFFEIGIDLKMPRLLVR